MNLKAFAAAALLTVAGSAASASALDAWNIYNGLTPGAKTRSQADTACRKRGGYVITTNYGSYYSCQVNGASAWSVPVAR